MSTTITREQFVQRYFDVSLEVEFAPTTNVGDALAKVIAPGQVQRQVSLWYSQDEAAEVDRVAASIEAVKRARKLAQRDSGLRLRTTDFDVRFLRERLVDVDVERDADGRIVSKKPVRR